MFLNEKLAQLLKSISEVNEVLTDQNGNYITPDQSQRDLLEAAHQQLMGLDVSITNCLDGL